MLVLTPTEVTFAGSTWDRVRSIAIDRRARDAAVEWTDNGPHASFADVPQQRVDIRITREITATELDAPLPGDQATLSFQASTAGTDAGRVRVSASCTVLSVAHDIGASGSARRVIELIAVSSDGRTDPVSIVNV